MDWGEFCRENGEGTRDSPKNENTEAVVGDDGLLAKLKLVQMDKDEVACHLEILNKFFQVEASEDILRSDILRGLERQGEWHFIKGRVSQEEVRRRRKQK